MAGAWLGRGTALFELARYNEALAAYDRALGLKPDSAYACLGRGNVYGKLKRYDDAFAAYKNAVALKPDLAEAHVNEAFFRLLLEDMECGWKKYQFRWDTKDFQDIKRNFSQPLWLGDFSIANKTILLHAEQGLGDTLLMIRYVPMVAAMGASVILEVDASLKTLFQGLKGVSTLIVHGDDIPQFDVHCPVMSLPLAFKARLDAIPAPPYLTARTDIIEKWRARLGEASVKIGVAWAGSQTFRNDLERSVLLQNILPVFSIGVAKYFSIQKDLRAGDQEILDANPQIIQLGNEIEDFHDTAAIMMSLDLIISSDTSVANLAGALGQPVWVLLPVNPDWRWLLGRSDTPWYPTARLFRQPRDGDWQSVVNEVCAQLKLEVARSKRGCVSS